MVFISDLAGVGIAYSHMETSGSCVVGHCETFVLDFASVCFGGIAVW